MAFGKKKKDIGHAAPEQELKDDKGNPLMTVKVYGPFKNYFDEPAYSISGINHTGPFDILPHHHNFMSLIDACELDIKAPTGDKKIRINRAVMHVKADKVVVFLDV
jgi:F0F1-type ATP synthase epsilon subunit